VSPSLARRRPELARLRSVLTWRDLAALGEPAADLWAPALEEWAALDDTFGDHAGAQTHRALVDLLRRVAAQGAVEAHRTHAAEQRRLAPEALRSALERMDAAVSRWVAGDDSAVLDAKGAWVDLARSGALEDLEPRLRLSLMCDGAALHEAAFRHRPTAEGLDHMAGLLEHVVAAFRHVAERPGGCRIHVDPRLSRCTGRLAVSLRMRYDVEEDPADLARARQLVEGTVGIVHPDAPDAGVWRLERAVMLGYGYGYGPESDVAEAVAVFDEVAAGEPVGSALRLRALDLCGRGAWADYRTSPTGPGRPRLDDAVELWQTVVNEGADEEADEATRTRLATARLARFLELGATGDDAGAAADALRVPPDPSVALRLCEVVEPRAGRPDLAESDLSDLTIEALRRLLLDPAAQQAADRLAPLAVLVASRAERLDHEPRAGRAADLLRAARALRGARALADQSRAAGTVGAHLMRLYESSGDLTVLTRAVEVLESAADDAAALAADERVRVLSNLVAALRTRAGRESNKGDLLAASDRADEAVRIAEADGADADLVVALSSRAQVHHDRWRARREPDRLRSAIEDWRAVLALDPVEERWLTAYNLGNALVSLEDAGALDEAVSLLVGAVRHLDRTDGPDAALAAGRLAEALHRRALALPTRQDREHARAALWSARAVRWARAVSPETLMAVAWDWGARAAGVDDHAAAADAYSAATDALEALVHANRLVGGKETWLAEGFGLGTRAAYSLVRCGRADEAVMVLERSRGLILLDALGRGEEHEPVPDFATLRTEVGQVVLYLVPAPREGVAIVVDPDAQHARAVPLPPLTEAAVGGRVRAFQRTASTAGRSPQAWRRTLERTLAWLGEVLAPVVDSLPARMFIVPTGALSFLPVHAAGTAHGPLLDRAVIEMAPAVLPVLRARRRPRGPVGGPVLAVADPWPTSQPPLRFGRLEAAVARRLGPATQLRDTDATLDAVLDALPSASLLHLACHGRADVFDPRASGLVLADDLLLTVDRLGGLDLDRARLAFLSACETGVPGAKAPDEVLTLGSAFFAAGVDGVVSSLWQVDDRATLVLVACFYGDEAAATDPALALASAQRRMRMSTTEALTDHLRRLHDAGRLDPETWRVLEEELRSLPGERPFEHPDGWAGFLFSGISRDLASP